MKRTILVVDTDGLLVGDRRRSAFTAFSYCLVAFPCVAFVAAYTRMGGLSTDDVKVREYFQRRAGGATLSTVAPGCPAERSGSAGNCRTDARGDRRVFLH